MIILLAASAALSFAAGSVLAKRGMQHTNAFTALLLTSSVAAIILGFVVLFDRPENVTPTAFWFFVMAGLIGDGVARFSMLSAVDRLGPSIAIPIQTAAYPLIAVTGGVVLLSETINMTQVLGAAAVVAGIWVLLAPSSNDVLGIDTPRRWTVIRWSALPLPLLAGVAFAVSDLFRKSGLEETPDPAFGALVAVVTMLTVLVAATASSPQLRRQVKIGTGSGWLIAAGTSIAVALLTLFKALEGGAVSVVGPIIAAQPLGVVMLSWALLHNIERVTLRMVLGAVMVVAGVVLIAVSAQP
ncbi:MAG: DMT family transporter [Acidimicrobiia bacterium]|nr:DMT family transporter [Acidimicrobiia bacterium]